MAQRNWGEFGDGGKHLPEETDGAREIFWVEQDGESPVIKRKQIEKSDRIKNIKAGCFIVFTFVSLFLGFIQTWSCR